MTRTPLILMLGTDPQAPGGISSVLRHYCAAGLLQRWPVRIIATWHPGTLLQRLHSAGRAWWRVMRLLCQRGQVQAVHAHTAARGSFWRKSAFLLPAHWLGIPTILHLHDGGFPDWFSQRSRLTQRLIRSILHSMDRVVVLTPGWEQSLRQWAPRARGFVLPNPVEVSRAATPCKTRSHVRIGWVLFLGRVWAAKGVHELLEAFAAGARQNPHWRLICAGDGDLSSTRARVDALGLAHRVHLTGWVDESRRQRLLRCAQLLVLPSHAEGLPLSVLEAMAAGVPVLASDVGGIPEALSEGGGRLCRARDADDLREKMIALIQNPEACRRMGEEGRQVALRRYATACVMDTLDRLYEELALHRGTA